MSFKVEVTIHLPGGSRELSHNADRASETRTYEFGDHGETEHNRARICFQRERTALMVRGARGSVVLFSGYAMNDRAPDKLIGTFQWRELTRFDTDNPAAQREI